MAEIGELDWAGVREFLSDIYGAERLNEVWTVGFSDIAFAEWNGKPGLDHLSSAGSAGMDVYFAIGRVAPGAARRLAGNIVAMPLLIADDIGTKVDRTLWETRLAVGFPAPTFRIETSPGNETWGWALVEPSGLAPGVLDTHEQQRFTDMARISVLLRNLGLSDILSEPNRLIRLPIGWNSKPAYVRDGAHPRVKLLEWNRGARVDLDEIGVALTGDPNWREAPLPPEAQTMAQLRTGVGALDFSADMSDPLVRLADVLGMQPQPGNKPGVVDAHCPNIAQHVERHTTGFSFLGGGLAECHHGPCQGMRSTDFRAMMLDAYDRMIADMLSRGEDLGDLPTSASEFLARADLESHGVEFEDGGLAAAEADAMAARMADAAEVRGAEEDAALTALAQRFVYVTDMGAFFDTERRRMYSLEQFDGHEAVTAVIPVGESGMKRACNRVRNHPRRRVAAALTYLPGETAAVVEVEDEKGFVVPHVNGWAPSNAGRAPGVAPARWLHLLHHIIPNDEYRNWLIQWMAARVQWPWSRSTQVPVLASGQGTGKDLIIGALERVIGQHNVSRANPEMLASPFNEWLMAQLVVLPEMKLARDGSTYARLKDWTGNPSRLTINAKFLREFTVPPTCSFIGSCNDLGDLHGMEHDDRRIAPYNCPADPLDEQWYFDNADAMHSPDDVAALHDYLLSVDLTGFSDHARAPRVCGSRQFALSEQLPNAARWVYDLLTSGEFTNRRFFTIKEIEDHARGLSDRELTRHLSARMVRDGATVAGCRAAGQVRAGRDRLRIWFGPAATDEDRKLSGKKLADALDEDRKTFIERAQAALLGG